MNVCPSVLQGLRQIYRQAYGYKKCGVMLMGLKNKVLLQASLFDNATTRAKAAKTMAVMDTINRTWGRGTLRTAATGTHQRWAMRSENRSPRYTTCWDELPSVQA